MALSLVQRSVKSFSPGGANGKPVDILYLDVIDDAGTVIASFTKDAFCRPSFDASNSIHVARAKYDFAVDGCVQGVITPANSETIPTKAIIVGGTVNSTTAVTSGGSATV